MIKKPDAKFCLTIITGTTDDGDEKNNFEAKPNFNLSY